MKKEKKKTYHEWLAELEELIQNTTSESHVEANFEEYFNDGFTPQRALEEVLAKLPEV